EILVGAELHRDASGLRSGRVYVLEAASGNVYLTIDSPTGDTCARFGWSVASIGDVDGDAVGDFAVGAPRHRATPSLKKRRCF
ncbi:MAG TPA: integrin alpha, partial [Candidatus Saccharimonadales bacterium]|nr:integrin alpha [Candidatus Saccharimonadales bacterium]